MRRPGKGIFRLFRGQTGFSLIEVIVAVAILGTIGVVFMNALGTSFRSTSIQDEQITAESLARTQLEIIKASDYLVNYEALKINAPPQYFITIESPYVLWNDADDIPPDVWIESGTNTGLQKITVRVSRDGGKTVLTVEALKID